MKKIMDLTNYNNMLNKNRVVITCLLLLVFIFSGCEKTWDEHYNTTDASTEKDKVIAELEKIPEISSFVNAVKGIDELVELLDQNRLYTILAPKNDAFETVYNAETNEEKKQELIMYHFLSGKYKYKDFSTENLLAFNDKYLNVSVDANSKILFDGASTIIEGGADNLCLNGMIQIIDQPLVPLSNLSQFLIYNEDFQVFADAINSYTKKEFNEESSLPVSINDDGDVVYDSIFNYYNPFLSGGNEVVNLYGINRRYTNIRDKDLLFTAVLPNNFDEAIAEVAASDLLNGTIYYYDLAGPILSNFILNGSRTPEQVIASIKAYRSNPDNQPSIILNSFADLLENNLDETLELSNGNVISLNDMEYDLAWLIKEQGGLNYNEKDRDYQNRTLPNFTYSENVDTVIVNSNNILTKFYEGTDTTAYQSIVNEWVNVKIYGDFYPVDYQVMVRGRIASSGTYNINADGSDLGNFDFSTAPSGDLDTEFDVLGTVSITQKKSFADIKFTFVDTHPGTKKNQQYLWIREIKLVPILE